MAKLSPTQEDYLETIFLLESEHKAARPKDIADNLQVQRASVTGALQGLSEKGLVNYQPYSAVTLTSEGFRVATKVVHRHRVLAEFLQTFLQLAPEVAEANACRLEHHIDDEALERLIAFIKFVQHCPRTGPDWLQAFTRFCEHKGDCENCSFCLRHCLETYEDHHRPGT